MKTNLNILTAIILTAVLFTSCSKESATPYMDDTQIYELSTPAIDKGHGEQDDEIVRVNSTIMDKNNSAVAGAEVHLFNAKHNAITYSNASGEASIDAKKGTYNYQVFNKGMIVLDEQIEIFNTEINRVDIIK